MRREFIIFKTINLSNPRKIVMNNLNNLIFESKLKDIRLNEYHKIIGYTIGMLFYSKHFAYARSSVETSSSVIQFFNYYAPPLFLTTVDLIKLGIPIRIHMKNSRISED